jgi:cell division protein ZapA
VAVGRRARIGQGGEIPNGAARRTGPGTGPRKEPDVAVDQTAGIISVEIQGQRYPIKSALDPAYVRELAGYVHAKMAAAAEEAQAADTLRIAVVAALNIADEFFRSRDGHPDPGALARRAADLESLLDRAIALAGGPLPPGPPPPPDAAAEPGQSAGGPAAPRTLPTLPASD